MNFYSIYHIYIFKKIKIHRAYASCLGAFTPLGRILNVPPTLSSFKTLVPTSHQLCQKTTTSLHINSERYITQTQGECEQPMLMNGAH